MIDIVKVITTYNESFHDLVCNNAIWATGEISLKASKFNHIYNYSYL